MKQCLIVGLVALIFSSCSIQRRLYNPGFHIEGLLWLKKGNSKAQEKRITSNPRKNKQPPKETPSASDTFQNLTLEAKDFLPIENDLIETILPIQKTPIGKPLSKKAHPPKSNAISLPQFSFGKKLKSQSIQGANKNHFFRRYYNNSSTIADMFLSLGVGFGSVNLFFILIDAYTITFLSIMAYLSILFIVIGMLFAIKGISDAIKGDKGLIWAIYLFITAVLLLLLFSWLFFNLAGIAFLFF